MKFSPEYEEKLIQEHYASSRDLEKRIAEFNAELDKGIPISYSLDTADIRALSQLPSAQIPQQIKEWMFARFEQLIRNKVAPETKAETKEDAAPITDPSLTSTITPQELRVLAALPKSPTPLPMVKGLDPVDAREYYIRVRHPDLQWVMFYPDRVLYSFPPMVEATKPCKINELLAKCFIKEAVNNQAAFKTTSWDKIIEDQSFSRYISDLGHLFSSVEVHLADLSVTDPSAVGEKINLEIIKQIKKQKSVQKAEALKSFISHWFNVNARKVLNFNEPFLTGRKASTLTPTEKLQASCYLQATHFKYTNFVPAVGFRHQVPEFHHYWFDKDHVRLTCKDKATGEESVVHNVPVQEVLVNAAAGLQLCDYEQFVRDAFKGRMEFTPYVRQILYQKSDEMKSSLLNRYVAEEAYIRKKYPFTHWHRVGNRLIPDQCVKEMGYFTRLTTDLHFAEGENDLLPTLWNGLEPLVNKKAVRVSDEKECREKEKSYVYIDLSKIKSTAEIHLPEPKSFTELATPCKGWDLTKWHEKGSHIQCVLEEGCLFLQWGLTSHFIDVFDQGNIQQIFEQYGVEELLSWSVDSIKKIHGDAKQLRIETSLYKDGSFHSKEFIVPAEFVLFLAKANCEIKKRQSLAMIKELTSSKLSLEEDLLPDAEPLRLAELVGQVASSPVFRGVGIATSLAVSVAEYKGAPRL